MNPPDNLLNLPSVPNCAKVTCSSKPTLHQRIVLGCPLRLADREWNGFLPRLFTSRSPAGAA